MAAFVLQINVSRGGVPKRPVPRAHFAASGVEGDGQADLRHHGGPRQAVCLFPVERIAALVREGIPVFPGALGENVTTAGLEVRDVRVGDVYALGDEVEIEITKPRAPCTTIQVYAERIIKRLWGPAVPWGESGFYASVRQGGNVRANDPIRLTVAGPKPPPRFTQKIA